MMHKVISQYSKPDPDICLDFLLKLVEFAGSQIRRGQILVPKSWIVDSDQKMLRILRPKQKRHPLNSSCHLRSICCHLYFHSAPPSLRRVYNWQNRTPYVAWKYHSWLNLQNHLIQLGYNFMCLGVLCHLVMTMKRPAWCFCVHALLCVGTKGEVGW